MTIEIKDDALVVKVLEVTIPLDRIRDLGYKIEKIEEEPKPDPKPIPTKSLSAREMAIELSGKPNFLVGLSANRKAMVEQGIKPNIFYAYLTESWRTWNENDDYIDIVIKHAIANDSIPMFTYYVMAKKVEDRKDTSASDREIYLSDLEAMFVRIARFDIPVLVHLEPDLF